MNRSKPAIGAIILATAALAMSACSAPAPAPDPTEEAGGGGLEALIEEAKAEGSLTVYASSSPGILDILIPAFQEEYGITANVLRLNSGELTQRFLAEGDTSEADVIEVPIDFFAANPDLFVDLSEEEVPGYDAFPEAARSVPDAVVSYVSPWVIVYNTDQVAEDEVPTTWKEVVEEWEGQYIFTDPTSSSSYMAFVNEVEKVYGAEFLADLNANKGQLGDSAATAAQQIASGEFAMSIPNYPGQVPPLAEAGAPIAYTIIQDPPAVLPMSLGITESAKNSAAARLFVAWRISEAGQRAVCETGFNASPLAEELGNCEIPLPDGWEPYETGLSETRVNQLLDDLGL